MYKREDKEFEVEDVMLRGWFYTPTQSKLPAPCIIMTHGFSALKEHYLDKFAKRFAEAGLCVFVYDNRNFGDSTGEPRLEVDPLAQIRDMKNAINYVQNLKCVDSEKIGLWGTSFSGGVVLAVSANDKRVGCVVAQVPFISGHHKFLQTTRPDLWEKTRKKYIADEQERLAGNPATMIPVVTDDPEKKPAIMKISSAYTFFTSIPTWQNQVTLRSVENSGEFEPGAYIEQISPIPLLFIVAKKDTINATDLALKAYDKAREPKNLILIEGDHFAPYVDEFETCSTAACEWYEKYLLRKD